MSSSRVTFALSFASFALASAACGFDGAGTAGTDSVVSPTDPAGPGAHPVPPPAGSATPDAGGPGPSTPVTPCSDSTLSFDGVDDFAIVADSAALDLSGDFTVEAWIKPGANVATGAEMDVVSHHDAAASRGWVLLLKGGRVEIVVYGNETLSSQAHSAGNAGPTYVAPGKWAHVAGSKEADTLRVYYDGVLRDTQQLGFLFGRDTYSGALRLGRAASTNGAFYQGELDDVRLSKITRYAGANAPKPTAVLSLDDSTVAAWHFDEAGGSKLMDAMGVHDGTMAPDSTAPSRVQSTCIPSR